jgi:aminoglycoside/choline kinase family phosphotransferase
MRRTLKTCLLDGELGGAAVIAKVLAHADPLWRWYFEREVTLYRRFALEPPPVRTPRLYAADPARGVLVLERLGAALSPRRQATRIDAAAIAALLEALGRLNRWTRGLDLAPTTPPLKSTLRSMRARLLEDPSGPLAWFVEGFRRCYELGVLREQDAARMTAALEGHSTLGFCHGDLLLRNVLRDGDGVALVDWECAGAHPQDWDLALLWAGLPAELRPQVEEVVLHGGGQCATPARWAAFLAAVAYALAREIKFARGGAPGGALGRLTAAMAEVQERLHEAHARLNSPAH